MKTIELTRGMVALVDEADYDWLMRWKWCARPGRHGSDSIWYACRRKRIGESEKRVGNIDMHIALLGKCPIGVWDHRDGNGLNNQRVNLRPASFVSNNGNQRLMCNNASGFKGVSRHRNKWQAAIAHNHQWFYLGKFAEPQDAARAYDVAAVNLFGEFAKTNAMMGLL